MLRNLSRGVLVRPPVIRAEQEIRMTSLRNMLYAALLAMSTISFAPNLASAQEPARGRFTLTHDVHWVNAVVPAGQYRFTFESATGGNFLKLAKLDGSPLSFVFFVEEMDQAKPGDPSELVLSSTAEGSYVSVMQLPESGMTLRFAKPARFGEKIASAATPATTGQ